MSNTTKHQQNKVNNKPIASALAGLSKFDPQVIDELIKGLERSLDSICAGDSDSSHALEFRYASEVAAAIERSGIVKGLRDYIDSTRVIAKGLSTPAAAGGGTQNISENDVAVLKEFIELHRFQLTQITIGEYKKAMTSASGEIGGKMQQLINGARKRK